MNFPMGPHASMTIEVIHAFGVLKKAAAITNNKFGLLSDEKMKVICRVCDEITEGRLDEHFPLVIWQTGLPFSSADNKFESLAANDAIVETHGAIKQLAVCLNKIVNRNTKFN